ncbi:hypothetical protein HR12_48045 [Microbacterium sp. SUBG005]|nr:hypothetical protein HR12_48045 [Microbacterium sp. SUBG005]
MAEVAAEQIETVSMSCAGSLVGFWMPRIYQGITVAGLHLHFLSATARWAVMSSMCVCTKVGYA